MIFIYHFQHCVTGSLASKAQVDCQALLTKGLGLAPEKKIVSTEGLPRSDWPMAICVWNFLLLIDEEELVTMSRVTPEHVVRGGIRKQAESAVGARQ